MLNAAYILRWPADLYIEGGDQYRGWFQSSLLVGVGVERRRALSRRATHGWALDGEGRAMHKSLGNSIEPEEIIKKSGAELIRLWSASVDFSEDARVSDTILDAPYRRLSQAAQHFPLCARQSLRFRSGERCGARRAISWNSISGFWCAPKTLARCRVWFDDFAFHKVYHAVYDFATVDLSSIYFDVLKDRLYTSATRRMRGAARKPRSTG